MKLGAFIAAHAAASPDKVAVRCGADAVTFARSWSLASYKKPK